MNAEILEALKRYIRRGDTYADLKWRLMNKLGAFSMTSEGADSYLAKAHADLEAGTIAAPVVAPVVPVNNRPVEDVTLVKAPEPVVDASEIDLATADPEALGLDPFSSDEDARLNDAILETKRRAAAAFDPLPQVPAALKQYANWVTYESKSKKAPIISGTNINAKSDDSATWVDYATLCANIRNEKGYLNPGFVCDGERSGYLTGIDIDGCKTDDGVATWVQPVLDAIGPSYTEWTPNNGLRVWVRANFGDNVKFLMDARPGFGNKAQKVEVFGDGLYFTVTGNRAAWSAADVAELSPEQVAKVLEALKQMSVEKPKDRKSKTEATPADPAFKKLFDKVGWKPLEDRMKKMPDDRFNNLSMGSELIYCPMPGHQPRSREISYSPCFGTIREYDNAVCHCFGCGFSGDLVSTIREFDAGEDGGKVVYSTMYDCARAICKEQGLNPDEYFPQGAIAFTQATAQPVSSNPARTDANLGEAIRRAMRADGPREKRAFDYEGLIPWGVYCLCLGAMKAEKSLFNLRMAMHYACGKHWLNCRNLIGPVEVLYFDSENDGDEVDDRWEELLTEFDSSEQILIEQNLHIVKGKKLAREEKISIEYDNTALWLKLVELYPNVKVVYLDCWYQLQNIKSADAGAQKSALEMFESYFPSRTLFLLHHTGREDSESLQKKKPMGLRELGPERWSNRVSQSIVVLKKADLIMCQEKRYDIDEEGTRIGEYIDFQIYSRSGPGTPLLTFEPVYSDEHGEYKYRRKLVTNLTTSAASLLSKVRDKGPWLSKRELVNEVGGGGRQYLVLAELQFKGFLMHDERGYWFKEDVGSIISDASKNPVALKQAGEFLKRVLTQGPMPEALVQQLAKSEGVLLGPPIRYTGCRSYLNKEDGQHYWTMNIRDEDEMTAREIRKLIDANPTITKVVLIEKARCSKHAVEKAIKALGLVKAPGRSGAWGPQRVENAES